MNKELTVLLLCDADSDRPDYGGTRFDDPGPMIWRGLREGAPRLVRLLRELRDSQGRAPAVTWCWRADEQVARCHGHVGWAVESMAGLIDELVRAGHGLGWHPHHWRWSEEHRCWLQEIHDTFWQQENLARGAEAFSTVPAVSRLGWHFANETTMNGLEALGVRLDMSAMPGMFHEGGKDGRGSCFIGEYDWTRCKRTAYRPHPMDVQAHDLRPAGIIELPCTTVRSQALLALLRLRYRLRAGANQKMGIASAVNITAHPFLFGPMIGQALAETEARGQGILTALFHPDELLDAGPKAGGIPVYRATHVADNIRALLRRAAARNIVVNFGSPEEMIEPLSRQLAQLAARPVTTEAIAPDRFGEAIDFAKSVFDPQNRTPDFCDRLRWKYENFGAAGPMILGAKDSGRLIGQYVIVPQKTWWFGREIAGALSCDTAILPEMRGRGILGVLARRHFERLREAGFAFAWGFPNSKIQALWFRSLAWGEVGPFPFLLRPVRAGNVFQAAFPGKIVSIAAPLVQWGWNRIAPLRKPCRELNLRPVERFDDRADRLWEDLRTRVDVAVVRDASYLNRRYGETPGPAYRLFMLEHGDRTVGLAVTRAVDKRGLKALAICELILAFADLAFFDDALACLVRQAKNDGLDAVGACCLPHMAERRAFLRNRFLPVPLPLQPEPTYFGACPLRLEGENRKLYDAGRWYISWGDSDTI